MSALKSKEKLEERTRVAHRLLDISLNLKHVATSIFLVCVKNILLNIKHPMLVRHTSRKSARCDTAKSNQ